MKRAAIVEACRTPVGNMGGVLRPLSAYDLAVDVMRGALSRSGIDPREIDEVIMGQCRQSSDDPNIARLAALKAGIPEQAAGFTVMRQCASGMTAVHCGAMSIMTGVNGCVLAGGVESMSNGIFYLRNARYGVGTGNHELVDSVTEGQFQSQPNEIYGRYNMGATAEKIAQVLRISREDQDAFALRSQQRAEAAVKSGRFVDEIVPVTVPQGRKGPSLTVDADEPPRFGMTLEKLAKLKPCFPIRTDGQGRVFNDEQTGAGTVTPGNSCGRNDGASSMLLMEEEKAKALGIKPIARIIGLSSAGCDPRTMGLGPVYAVPKALKNAGLTMEDIQLIELNEAFAAQSLGCIRQLGWEDKLDIINVNGGAIALGHPVGSSGCRILVTLVHEMKKRGLKYGLATLCIAGGMGQATVVELCENGGT